MTQTLAGGVTIPDGVNPTAFESGDVIFLSGTPGSAPGFTDLTGPEISLFDSDLRKLAFQWSLERDLSQLYLRKRDGYLYAAAISKSQLTNRTFGGLLKGSGFNMQAIRPITILSSVSVADGGGGGVAVLNWKRTFSATGWQALFGSNKNADPVSLGVTGNSTTAITTYQRVVIAAPYILSVGTSPLVVEVKAFVQTTSYAVYPVHWLALSDIHVFELPGILLGLLNQQFSIEANIQT
ncbi:MAG: hypothetical protein ACRECH_12915, partial [Nitrososphaerales archaeon]